MIGRMIRTVSGSGIVVGPDLDRYLLFRDLSAELSGKQENADLADVLSNSEESWLPLLAAWDRLGTRLVGLAESADTQPRDLVQARLVAPLPCSHPRIFAAGGNFPDHMAAATKATTGQSIPEAQFISEKTEQGLPPWGFTVLPETVIGHGGTVTPPPSAVKIDYEGEVAAVVGRGGRFLRPQDVKFIGASCWSDFSIRDPGLGIGRGLDRGYLKWTFQKNFETGSSMGPWLTVNEGLEVDDIDIQLLVNGAERQRSTTASMIWSFAEIAAHVSEYVELLPGDIIASGTPAGTAIEAGRDGAFLDHGDEVRVVSKALGTLENSIARQ